MSAQCNYYSQYCKENCCDEFGSCPSYSGKPCFYNYSFPDPRNQVVQFPLPILIGMYFGVLFVFITLVLLCYWWENRKKTDQQLQQDMEEQREPTSQLLNDKKHSKVSKCSKVKERPVLEYEPESNIQLKSKAHRSRAYGKVIPYEAQPRNQEPNPTPIGRSLVRNCQLTDEPSAFRKR